MNFNEFSRTYIIAEIGVNHEGDETLAAGMIEKAATAGADAVKFQTYRAEEYVSSEQPERLERVGRWALSRDAFTRLAGVAKENGITFFSTPLGIGDVAFLDGIAPMFKVASGEITYLDMIREIAATGKPVILSTGLADEEEIAAAVNCVLDARPNAQKDGTLMLMHCVSAYPTPPEDANILNMRWLKERFGLPVGYSDHTLGIKACEIAVAAGAVAVEKHFTYRKENQKFRDHEISADPVDLAAMVAAIREAEIYLGHARRRRSAGENEGEEYMRRSLAAARDIPAGAPIEAGWLTALRPAWGMGPNDGEKIIGKKLNRARKAGEIIRAEDIEDCKD
ncbi:MAG TPA: hypothetical protein ENI55_00315 [Alphaproteobacteria bacterium]|nr:hypothetical protein [Alphaproteobacteria bacterium]